MRKSPQRPARPRRPRPREFREPSTTFYTCLISSRDGPNCSCFEARSPRLGRELYSLKILGAVRGGSQAVVSTYVTYRGCRIGSGNENLAPADAKTQRGRQAPRGASHNLARGFVLLQLRSEK